MSQSSAAEKLIPIPDLEDLPSGESKVDRAKYKYWRLRILYSTIIGYATFYMVRQNFAMAIPSLKTEFDFSNKEVGLIMTIFSLVYGAGKFFNGYLSDRSNARYFMAIGLMGSAFISVFMGMGSGLLFFGIFWAFNAWFQSMGWPPAARMITHWFTTRELGTKWAIGSSSHQLGGAVIMVMSGYIIATYGWRYAFFIPAAFAVLISIFLLNRLRDTPKSVGLPPPESYKVDHGLAVVEDEGKISTKELFSRVFANKMLWCVCVGNFALYIVRMGVFNWAPSILHEYKGAALTLAGWQVACYEIAGLVGGVGAGMLSDRLFKGRRGPVATLYMLFLSFALVYMWKIPAGHEVLDTIALFAVGFLVYGPHVLAGVASADFASKKAVGTANGFISIFGALGTACAGVGLGWVVDVWGWNGGFIFFTIAALIAAVAFSLTWKSKAR